MAYEQKQSPADEESLRSEKHPTAVNADMRLLAP
jgi:hypothetical protein